MRVVTGLFGLLFLLAATPLLAEDPPSTELRGFELGEAAGWPAGWTGGPPGTVHPDSVVAHGGSWSARLERDSSSAGTFTSVTGSTGLARQGRTITLRGYLKTEGVEGRAGLWLRLDGDTGSLGFDNMHRQSLEGTSDWAEYTINLPYNPDTRSVVFGALLSGTGRVWVDDLQLLVDGKPFAEAPERVRELTVLDTDTEFDEGSGFAPEKPTGQQLRNLALLGKVWGFLKYHHPAVTSGGHHWDYQLFRALPPVMAAADNKEAAGALLTWLDGLGPVPPCDPCAQLSEDLDGEPRLGWLEDEKLLGRALSRKLQEVYRNRHAGGPQFYVDQVFNVGNPRFENERVYQRTGLPDPGYRLLALLRYWNIIEYWFPSRDLIDRDWDEVLTAYLPEVLAAEDAAAYQLVMLRLIAEVRDGHANLYSADDLRPPVGACRLPVVIRFLENRAVVTAYPDSVRGAASGLQVGDVIRKIDGAPVAELVKLWEPYYPASNPAHRLHTMARNLTRGELGPVVLEIEREGQVRKVTSRRVPSEQSDWMAGRTHDLSGETFRLLGDDVAYLKLSSVELPRLAGYLEQAEGTRGLIVDIRNYPSAFVVFFLGGRLVTEPTPFVCFTIGDLANPGAFRWRPNLSLPAATPPYTGRVMVLVDETSMSQAEYTAMALRAGPRASVVGSTTAGADGNISPIALPGGLATHISGIGVYYPDRRPTQRVGIVPDVEVRPTIAGVRAGRDEVLEEALRQILGPGADGEELWRRYR